MDVLAPQALTIFEVTELNHAWQEISQKPVTVDLSQVTDVDAAGLQLLLHWHLADPAMLSFGPPSQTLRLCGDTLNLSDTLWPREVTND